MAHAITDTIGTELALGADAPALKRRPPSNPVVCLSLPVRVPLANDFEKSAFRSG